MQTSQGKFLIFEGIDGSGKTTQIEFLKKYLQDRSIPFEVVSFPQYGKNEYANKIHEYLSGKLGEIEVHDLAKIYAEDRKTAKEQILGWLENGKLVIANRYVSSSKAHLSAKLADDEREKFIKWLDELEYQTNGMPKPDLTILLKVDPKVGQQNALKDHKMDIHEKSLDHEQKAAQIFFELSQAEENWVVLDCMENGQMKLKEKIHQGIMVMLDSIIQKR